MVGISNECLTAQLPYYTNNVGSRIKYSQTCPIPTREQNHNKLFNACGLLHKINKPTEYALEATYVNL